MTNNEKISNVAQAESISPEQWFINRLHALKESDKGSIAKLKRNAGNTLAESRDVLPIFFKLIPPGLPQWKERHYFLIATLYPLANPAESGSLGSALKMAKGKNKTGEKGYDRRMEVLLDSDEDQLPFRLRQIVRLLKSAEVPVNWRGLLNDLSRWNNINRRVQEKWARDYYTD